MAETPEEDERWLWSLNEYVWFGAVVLAIVIVVTLNAHKVLSRLAQMEMN